MSTIFRAAAVYVALLVIFRVTGKRSLAQITPFDFILLLIISETTQQAMIGDDFSITNAVLAILTLVVLDVGISWFSVRFHKLDRWLNGLPLVIVKDGNLLSERMKGSRVTEDDVLMAARSQQGILELSEIRYAILERSGGISIIPRDKG